MASFETLDWYETPVYYDIVFDEDTRLEADFLERVAERYGKTRGRAVLEPACGSGRLVAEMAGRGWRVHGSDLSAASLAYARERLEDSGLRAKLEVADMSKLAPAGRVAPENLFDLAHCLVSTFKYLSSERAARAHLRAVAKALKPGGIYVLGFHLSEYEDTTKSRERWVCERDGVHVVCNIQSWPADAESRTEKMRSRLVVRQGDEERRTETHWVFRTYDVSEAHALIAAVPALEHLATFDFTYDLESEQTLEGPHLDKVLILRRR